MKIKIKMRNKKYKIKMRNENDNENEKWEQSYKLTKKIIFLMNCQINI